jgi:hypothetical protein
VYRLIDEQVHLIAGNKLVRMTRSIELLRRVRAQCESRPMKAPALPGSDAQPLRRSVGYHQRAQLAAMPGLLWSGVGDIEIVDVGCETPNTCRQSSVGLGLAHSRPGAVPGGRRYDVDKKGKSIGQPPVVGHINEAVASGRGNSYRRPQLIMIVEELIQPMH